MNTVLRPSGPLPPRVYWTRRLMLIAVIVLVTLLLWWLVTAAGDANQTEATDVGDSPSTPGSASTPTTVQPTTSADPTKKPAKRKPPTPSTQVPTSTPEQKQKPPKPTPTPLAEPTGDCDPTGVDMMIDVSDVKAGRDNSAELLLTSTDTPACTLSVTPSTLVVNVTSGDDIVWSSDDCPDTLLAKQLVVRSDPPSSYEFTWTGRRSSDGCQLDSSVVEPGGYWIEAALIGGEPHKAYFDIT